MMDSEILKEKPDFVMAANEEKLQGAAVLPEQQTQVQSRAAFEYILPQPSDGNAGMDMGMPETIWNREQRGLDAGHIRVAHLFERGAEAGGEEEGGLTHA